MHQSLLLYYYGSILLFASFYNVDCRTLQPRDVRGTINELHRTIENMQAKETIDFSNPLALAEMRGLYESQVRLYTQGKPPLYALRKNIQILDNNMFVTALINMALLDTYRLAHGPEPSDQQMKMSLEAISEFYNKNYNFKNSVVTFWTQTFNATTGVWVCTAENESELFDLVSLIPLSSVGRLLDDLGLDEAADDFSGLAGIRERYGSLLFDLPADFDCTFVNIGMGSLLVDMSTEFPESSSFWTNRNDNLTFVFEELTRVAYRPFSSEENVNTIDTRSYFYMRQFLQDADSDGNDLALIPTWVQNLDDIRIYGGKGNEMPFNINNIDLVVMANSIYGMTNGILSGLLEATLLEDPEIQQIYLNTSALIGYEIIANFSNRPDLALTYYPSEFQFYWFVSRTLAQLERRVKPEGVLPHPAMDTVRLMFRDALRGHAHEVITNKSISDSSDTVYFDDFLGNGDKSWTGKPLIRGEDRIFTTSMAVNALITMWTVFDDSTQKLVWDEFTPPLVKDTVMKSVNWLIDNVFSVRYRPWNAMFSGSIKGLATVGYWYPMNRHEFRNGTNVTDTPGLPGTETIFGVQGVPPASWYEEELQKPHFGYDTPQDFHGYNSNIGLPFPIWTSEPYTYASTMIALASYLNAV
ncbi:hypothetical protein ScPMuIL_016859 [Solemya velum]